jgi:chitinase
MNRASFSTSLAWVLCALIVVAFAPRTTALQVAALPTNTPVLPSTPTRVRTTAPGGGDNLIANGTFENGTISGWQDGSALAINTQAHSGSWSARTISPHIGQSINTTPGQRYSLSAWVRIASESGTDWGGFRIQVSAADWRSLVQSSYMTQAAVGSSWAYASLSFVATTARSMVDVGYFGGSERSMTAYIDDIEARLAGSPTSTPVPTNTLLSPTNTPTGTPVPPT